MSVFVMWSWMRWSATMPGPDVEKMESLQRRTGTDDGKTGGRSKCMSGRQLARTGRLGGSDAPRDMEQTEKPIRVRNAGENCVLWPVQLSGWTTARVPFAKAARGMPAAMRAPRARCFAQRSARPLGKRKVREETGSPGPD